MSQEIQPGTKVEDGQWKEWVIADFDEANGQALLISPAEISMIGPDSHPQGGLSSWNDVVKRMEALREEVGSDVITLPNSNQTQIIYDNLATNDFASAAGINTARGQYVYVDDEDDDLEVGTRMWQIEEGDDRPIRSNAGRLEKTATTDAHVRDMATGELMTVGKTSELSNGHFVAQVSVADLKL